MCQRERESFNAPGLLLQLVSCYTRRATQQQQHKKREKKKNKEKRKKKKKREIYIHEREKGRVFLLLSLDRAPPRRKAGRLSSRHEKPTTHKIQYPV